MKITDARVIQTGEKELMDAIIRDLDWDMIVEMLKTKYSLNLAVDRMEFCRGDLVVHQNQVAYKLDFDVKVTLSVMVDRRGECFDVVTSVAEEKPHGIETAVSPAAAPGPAPAAEKETPGAASEAGSAPGPEGEPPFMTPSMDSSQMASQIADLLADINRS